MGGEGLASVVAPAALTRPPPLRSGGHPLPLQSAVEGRGIGLQGAGEEMGMHRDSSFRGRDGKAV